MHLVGLGKIAIKVTLNSQFYPRRPDWFVIIHEDPCIRTLLPLILINKHKNIIKKKKIIHILER